MPRIDLNHIAPAKLQDYLATHSTIVACLCADWCDVCKSYRADFEALSIQFPESLFIWIDIEDQSSLVEDLDVDNFPTLLIQLGDIVGFYGTMQPDTGQLKRLVQSITTQTPEQLLTRPLAADWQVKANLRHRIAAHV